MRRKTEKAVLLALAFCAVALAASCSEMFVKEDNNPSVTLRQFCGYLSDSDYPAAFALTGSVTDVSPSDFNGSVEQLMMKKVADSLRIREISGVSVSGITASQTLSVTHIDLRLTVRKALDSVMKDTADYEWKHGSYKTDEEIAGAVNEALRSALAGDLSDCVITEKIKMQYRYSKGRWIPVMTGELYRAVTGCAAEASADVREYFEELRKMERK